MRLNPKLALHTLKAAYGPTASAAFADVLASAMEARQQRLVERNGRSRPGTRPTPTTAADDDALLVALSACEARRAKRDLLRLRGEEAAADELHELLLADLAGRRLPPAVYATDGD
jgi:hypothetical protein